ncbi:MAG TPA: DUF5658 family protein [Terriglobales bacterium]|nr:DUF5658 family protein [Terriglobales bacterium]
MKYLLSILCLSAALQAQSFTTNGSSTLPDAPSQQRFWTVENKVNVSLLAGLIAVDAVTTQRGLNQGLREVNPIMRPFVTRGAAGEAAGSALGFGAGVGVVYLLHRCHHYKAERITMRMIVAGESGFVANNLFAIR